MAGSPRQPPTARARRPPRKPSPAGRRLRLAPAWLVAYLRATREPATNALAVLPLLLLYGIGLLFTSADARSGVDPVSYTLRTSLTTDAYLAIQLGVAVAIAAVAAWHLRRATAGRVALTAPVAAESALYGVGMGGAILFLLDRAELLGASPGDWTLLERAVASAGAGLYEELLFRLGLLTLIAVALVRAFALPRWLAVGAAVAASSLVFAAAHHLAGEPLDLFAFSYRTVAGVFFAALFIARGFAVAAWTHAAYDFYVLGLDTG